MATRVCIVFPYNAQLNDFDSLLKVIKHSVTCNNLNTSEKKTLLITNMDTVRRSIFNSFVEYVSDCGASQLLDKVEIHKVWAVDTCQMWLAGYGKVIDDNVRNPETDLCVLQIPGDLKDVEDFGKFIDGLKFMRLLVEGNESDFVIGDFSVTPFGSKEVIDQYGTYPLLANWFPDVAKEVTQIERIHRPRSEFIATTVDFLEATLSKRKFAYEQTIAFSIHALMDTRNWNIGKVDLGNIKDYEENRGFREAIDQVERMERMLKLLWREKHGGNDFDVLEFERHERRSASIREAAVISFRNFLIV